MSDMSEETDPVKELMFEHVKNSQTIPDLVSEKRFDKVIDEIIEHCYDRVVAMGGRDDTVGVLATGMLHYIMTVALLSSQRKVEHKGVALDMVVPDIRTLEKDPKMALVILVPMTSDMDAIRNRIEQLRQVQPVRENIWAVLSEDVRLDCRTFVVSKRGSFRSIIFEIAKFANMGGSDRLKILRI